MAKKTKKAKAKKPARKQACSCCCGRGASNKCKTSKVEKLKKLAKRNSGKKKEKKGFFGKLFGK
jgi:hypothetical protein